MKAGAKQFFLLASMLAALAMAVLVLRHQLQGITWEMVWHAIGMIDGWRVVLSGLSACLSMAILAGYDVYAARLVTHGAVPPQLALFAGAAGNSFSSALGFPLLTGTALRYRLYASAGVSLGNIARITALAGGGIAFGYVSVIALALLFAPLGLPPLLDIPGDRLAGMMLIALFLLFWRWLAHEPRQLTWKKWSLPLPAARDIPQLILIGLTETAAAAFALYILLPPESVPNIATFALAYIGGILLGLVSHAPGGLGVFEATLLTMLGGGKPEIVAALLVYRLTFNLLPFSLLALGLLGFEVRRRR